MKNIAIIDADIVGKKKHRFPNLCCMKISSYHKNIGDTVTLKTDYENLDAYDLVYISKVFTDTVVPGEPDDKSGKNCDSICEWYADNQFLHQKNIIYGGTGFFYDKAPPLPEYIEHIMPDYHLYDEWISKAIESGSKRSECAYYIDYSIGYLTRGCFRGCSFCVNRNCKSSTCGSQLYEFMDESRPKLCFLDDNFFSHPKWRELIEPVVKSGKLFRFKQGLDERLLTEEKVIAMSEWKYDKEILFSFDNIEDEELIVSKLELIRNAAPNWKREIKFFLFCGYDKNDVYNDEFWRTDIRNLFRRIEVIGRYGCKPYVMRYEKVYESEYSSFYAVIAAWCNQPAMFSSFPFRLFCKCSGMGKAGYKKYKRDVDGYLRDGGKKYVQWTSMEHIERVFPEIANEYFDLVGCNNKCRNGSERMKDAI